LGICQEDCDVTEKIRNTGKSFKCQAQPKSARKNRKSGKKTNRMYNGADKPEMPGRFQECEQGVHVVVPLTLQLARFRFLKKEVNNIKSLVSSFLF
jgi:hypothetical protein